MSRSYLSSKPLGSGITSCDLSVFKNWQSGQYRNVMCSDAFPEVVMKRVLHSHRPETQWFVEEQHHQLCELKAWSSLCEAGFSNMVPSHDSLELDNGEIIIIVEKVEAVSDWWTVQDAQMIPEYSYLESMIGVAAYTALSDVVLDIQPGYNFVQRKDKSFVLIDAGA